VLNDKLAGKGREGDRVPTTIRRGEKIAIHLKRRKKGKEIRSQKKERIAVHLSEEKTNKTFSLLVEKERTKVSFIRRRKKRDQPVTKRKKSIFFQQKKGSQKISSLPRQSKCVKKIRSGDPSEHSSVKKVEGGLWTTTRNPSIR